MSDIHEAAGALRGRMIRDAHNRYGHLCLVLDNGRAVDVDASVSCGGYCYGGSVEVEFEIRDSFDDEGVSGEDIAACVCGEGELCVPASQCVGQMREYACSRCGVVPSVARVEAIRRAERAEREAAGLQELLTNLLVLVLEARLEHTCADHSHERRFGCPECKLVRHLDASGWTDAEAVRDA